MPNKGVRIKCLNGPTWTATLHDTGVRLQDELGQAVTIPWPDFARLADMADDFQAKKQAGESS